MKTDLHLLPLVLRGLAYPHHLAAMCAVPSAATVGAIAFAEKSGWIKSPGVAQVPRVTQAGIEALVKMGEDDTAWGVVCCYLERQDMGFSVPIISELLLIFKHSPLAARRMGLGLLQRQIADRAGLDIATICRCERQNRLPQSKIAVISYAAALEVTVEALTALAQEGRDRVLAKCGPRVDTPEEAAAWAAAHAPVTAGQDRAADSVHVLQHADAPVGPAQ